MVIANTAMTQTGAMLRNTELAVETEAIETLLKKIVGNDHYYSLDAKQLSNDLVDPMQANMLLLGYAWQRGTVPVSLEAMHKAIELGGGATANHLAFAWGRLCAQDAAFVAPYLTRSTERVATIAVSDIGGLRRQRETVAQLVETRSKFLADYQDAAYAARYRNIIDKVRANPVAGADSPFTEAVARNLFKLMAYKDEYEVARLLTARSFTDALKAKFNGGVSLKFHFALPMMRKADKATGVPKKTAFSGWIFPLLKVVAKGRVLRHTRFDPLGYSAERREERRLLQEYIDTLQLLLPKLTRERMPLFVSWANLPDSIRGYGHVKEKSIAAARFRQGALLEQILGSDYARSALRHESLSQDQEAVAES